MDSGTGVYIPTDVLTKCVRALPYADAEDMSAETKVIRRQPDLELALVGNCTIGALIERFGSIVWCCMPRFDSTPVFDALLRSGAELPFDGAMTVDLDGFARAEQSYELGTAIVRTRLWDGRGQGVERVDFAPRFIARDRGFRPAQLVRRIRPLAGHPRIRMLVKPHGDGRRRAADDDARQPSPALRDAGVRGATEYLGADHLCRRRHVVLAARAGESDARPRRDADRQH